MPSNPFVLTTVSFAFIPLTAPPSPTKCLAHAATLVLDERNTVLTCGKVTLQTRSDFTYCNTWSKDILDSGSSNFKRSCFTNPFHKSRVPNRLNTTVRKQCSAGSN